jgi:hypothetical protein
MKHIVRLLQWNMRGRDKNAGRVARRNNVFIDLLSSAPSLVVLQEASIDARTRLLAAGYQLVTDAGGTLLSAFRSAHWTPVDTMPITFAGNAIGLRLDSSLTGAKVSFWNVHMPSRKNSQDRRIQERVRGFLECVKRQRSTRDWAGRLEVISGDFNLQPHDEIFFPDGMNAHRSWAWCRRHGAHAHSLYNPTWGLFGRAREPLGSYYKASEPDKPWYLYDQTLLSPELVDGRARVRLIYKVAGGRLDSAAARKPDPNRGSDHFPVIVRFETPGH